MLTPDILKYRFTYAGGQHWTPHFWYRSNKHRIEWIPSVWTSPKWANGTWKACTEKFWRIRYWWGTLLSLLAAIVFFYVCGVQMSPLTTSPLPFKATNSLVYQLLKFWHLVVGSFQFCLGIKLVQKFLKSC